MNAISPRRTPLATAQAMLKALPPTDFDGKREIAALLKSLIKNLQAPHDQRPGPVQAWDFIGRVSEAANNLAPEADWLQAFENAASGRAKAALPPPAADARILPHPGW